MSYAFQKEHSNALRAASEKRNENAARVAEDREVVLEELKTGYADHLNAFFEGAPSMYERVPAPEEVMNDYITSLRSKNAAPPAEANRPRRNRRSTRRNNRRNNRRNSRKH